MSIECLNKAIKVKGLKPTKKLILILLANYADEKNTCYPSYSHIAKIVGLKDSKNVKNVIHELEKLGHLKIQNRYKEDGGFTSNRYTLTLGGVETPRGEENPSEVVNIPSNTKDYTKTINTLETTESKYFEDFWRSYPRKIEKKKAKQIFMKYDEKHMEKIVVGSKLFAIEKKNTEEQFIPHPATWLNQERWNDQFETNDLGEIIIKNKSNMNSLAG